MSDDEEAEGSDEESDEGDDEANNRESNEGSDEWTDEEDDDDPANGPTQAQAQRSGRYAADNERCQGWEVLPTYSLEMRTTIAIRKQRLTGLHSNKLSLNVA